MRLELIMLGFVQKNLVKSMGILEFGVGNLARDIWFWALDLGYWVLGIEV